MEVKFQIQQRNLYSEIPFYKKEVLRMDSQNFWQAQAFYAK